MIKNYICSVMPKIRFLIVLIILFFFNKTLHAQSKKDYIDAVNKKINYQKPYIKMQAGLFYESVLDEYKFFSVFEAVDEKFSTVCEGFTKYDVKNISMYKNNMFSVELKSDKCTSVTETKSGNEVKPTRGIIFMLDAETMSQYQAQKYLEALKFIFDK